MQPALAAAEQYRLAFSNSPKLRGNETSQKEKPKIETKRKHLLLGLVPGGSCGSLLLEFGDNGVSRGEPLPEPGVGGRFFRIDAGVPRPAPLPPLGVRLVADGDVGSGLGTGGREAASGGGGSSLASGAAATGVTLTSPVSSSSTLTTA